MFKRAHSVATNVSLNLFSISGEQIVLVHHYENRYAEAFAITKLRTFKHEPFLGFGGGLCYIACIVIRAVSQAKSYMITHESSYTVHAIRKSEIL